MTKSAVLIDSCAMFRAPGSKAGISCFKRAYGGGRCTWRGLDHFKAYVWSAVGAQPGAVRRLKPTYEPAAASRIATAIRSTPLACRCTPDESPKSRRYPSAKRHLAPPDQHRRRSLIALKNTRL